MNDRIERNTTKWHGWDNSNMPWSATKHQDDVCAAVFRGPCSMEDAASVIGAIDSALAAMPGPTAYRHEVKEPGLDEPLVLLSTNAQNPWSHWVGKHLEQCEYSCTPLYALTPAPDLASENDRLRAALEKIMQRVGGTVCPGQDMEMTRARVRFLEDDIRDIARSALERKP